MTQGDLTFEAPVDTEIRWRLGALVIRWTEKNYGGGLIRCAGHAAYRTWAELMQAWPHEADGAWLRVRVQA